MAVAVPLVVAARCRWWGRVPGVCGGRSRGRPGGSTLLLMDGRQGTAGTAGGGGEAGQKVPLLERLKFLGIYSSNLDEFFRVRIATLRRLVLQPVEDVVSSSSLSSILFNHSLSPQLHQTRTWRVSVR